MDIRLKYFGKFSKAGIIQFLLFLFIFHGTLAQGSHDKPIKVNVTSNFSFGAFYNGVTGGTVTVNTDLSRTSTGDIVLLGMGYAFSPVVIRFNGNADRVVSILNTPDVLLTGSNGGVLSLHVGMSDPSSPFITPNGNLRITIGGTLTVGPPVSNPQGNYSGSVNIIFIEE